MVPSDVAGVWTTESAGPSVPSAVESESARAWLISSSTLLKLADMIFTAQVSGGAEKGREWTIM